MLNHKTETTFYSITWKVNSIFKWASLCNITKAKFYQIILEKMCIGN